MFSRSLRLVSAMAIEIGPTRPKYIAAQMISLPAVGRLAVRLRLRPTVAVALTVS